MGAQKSRKGKGKYAAYRSANRGERHKETRAARLQRRIAKRKEWRIKKYGQTPQAELSSTTITLFRQWTVPLIGPKKEKPKPTETQQGDKEVLQSFKERSKITNREKYRKERNAKTDRS